MVKHTKAISPVVATALLLVVAVVAVVGFQTWFNTYQSGINSKVEQQSSTTTPIRIDRLERYNSTKLIVYFVNPSSSAINITQFKVVGVGTCTNASWFAGVPAGTMKQASVNGCAAATVVQGNPADVVAVTSAGVFPVTLIVR